MWSFVLTDLQGVVHGELTGSDQRKVSDPWMRIPTASCVIPLWHPLAETVLTTDCMLKCYRTDPITTIRTLVFHGIVLSVEEVGETLSQSISIAAVGPEFRLQKRLLGVTKAGIEFGTEAVKIDLSLIGKQIVDAANGRGETGISTNVAHGATFVNTGQTASTGKWWLKPAAEALNEVAGGLNSFEWRVRPTEAIAFGSFPRIAVIDFAPETSFRTTRPDAVYEYGTTRANVTGYSRKISRETLINRDYVPVSGWPDTPAVTNGVPGDLVTGFDNGSITTRGLYEEVVPDGGIIDVGLRQQLADLHIAVRKNGRQQITFNPAPDARPCPYVDYQPGEQIRARAEVRGVTRFDALFRVWGLTFDIDSQGSEAIDVELIEAS